MTVCHTWRGLVQHLSLLQADGEQGEPVLGCIREVVDDVLKGLLRVGEKAAVVSKQQLSDEFLDGFRAIVGMSLFSGPRFCLQWLSLIHI